MQKQHVRITLHEMQESIIAEFSQLDDWLEKYEHLVEEGRGLPPPPDDSFRTDENALVGCQSQVWIRAQEKDGQVSFSADSDSVIVKGILALLLRVLNERSRAEIALADLYFLREIGLSTHLSPARANGLALIVERMRELGGG